MDTYKSVFRETWSPYTAGALVGFINTMMFAYESPWTVFTGLRNWGLHFLEFCGIGDVAQISPFEHHSSVMDLGFLLGAFGAALVAREFAIHIPPLREAIKGLVGGALMGIGANLSRGCTVGGFYSSIASMSVSGLWMMLGLFIGVVVGLKYLIWEKKGGSGSSAGRSIQIPAVVQIPAGTVVIIAGLLGIPYYYNYEDFAGLAVLFSFTAALGIINQRSRFCIVRAIRDPFMTGDGEMTRGVIVAFMTAIVGFAILKHSEIREFTDHINPSAGWPALAGGVLFGIGMTLAGGCASGSLWRSGEGHIKLMLAVASFAIFAAGTHLFLQLVVEYSYIKMVFLPDVTGNWVTAILILFGVMALWHFVVSWNERSEKLVIF